MNYKLFLPQGAREDGHNVILENGLSFPRYAFVAVPIVGIKSNIEKDSLSENISTSPVYFDVLTNSFTLNKKIRDIPKKNKKYNDMSSLSTSSDVQSTIKFNFDGYINISNLISDVKKQITNIKESEASIIAYEQDIGYTTVRLDNLVDYRITTIDENDNYENLQYTLSDNLKLIDLLKYQLRIQNLVAQNGLSKKIIVSNLKNIANNIYENVLEYFGSENKFEIFSAYSEKTFFVSDEEFYNGEAIQLRFVGVPSSAVYLYAKELISILHFDKLYLDYFLDSSPRITIILKNSNNSGKFATRFEYNVIHDAKLVNIDNKFDDLNQTESDIVDNNALNSIITLNELNISRDKLVLQNFIKEALKNNFLQSEEEAVKFAYATGINISDIVTEEIELDKNEVNNNREQPGFYDDIDYDVDYSTNDNNKLRSKQLNDAIKNMLPSLIKCPPISNGGIGGKPNQNIFPMMSHVGFKNISDLTMIYNPEKTAGQHALPQSVRFNNPFLVKTIKGVTDKVEDGYLGELEGIAVYANRLGGTIAGIRNFSNSGQSGKSMLSSVSSSFGAGIKSEIIAKLTNAFFGIVDPTGAMLGCMQVDTNNGNINDQVVMYAMILASITKEKRSPITFEELAIAISHAKGETDQFSRTLGGNKIDETRNTEKEMSIAPSKIDNDANSKPIDIANVAINSVKTLIIDKLGIDLESKTDRKENQESSYTKYDSGSNHRDKRDQINSITISAEEGKKDEIQI